MLLSKKKKIYPDIEKFPEEIEQLKEEAEEEAIQEVLNRLSGGPKDECNLKFSEVNLRISKDLDKKEKDVLKLLEKEK